MDKIQSLELKISKLLRIGVIVAGVLLTIGGILHNLKSGDTSHLYSSYTQVPFKITFKQIILEKNYGEMIAYAGIFSLIFLPILRIFFTFILFLKQKENILAFITMTVLLTLFFNIFLGII